MEGVCVASAGAAAVPPEGGAGFAAIDLGTNNCRLLVGVPSRGGFRVVDSFSRAVRLGEGLQEHGRLSAEPMARTISALGVIAARLHRKRVRQVRAVATEACRRASNGREFLARAMAETGLAFDLISSREEAELTVESCAPLLRGPGRRALLFDIGGGSTELAWIRLGGVEPDVIGVTSLPVGVVTLAERFGRSILDPAGFERAVAEIREQLLPFERVHCIGHEVQLGGVRLLGTSGTVTTLAGVVLGLDRYRRPLVDGVAIDAGQAGRAVALLQALGREGLTAHPCVGPARVELVLPGCAIFEAVRRTWPMAQLTVADRGLREGMLIRMMRGGDAPPRPRRQNPAQRFGVRPPQAV